MPDEFEEGKEIPRNLIEQLLENANWAPTHGMTEPWRFFVFQGEGKRTIGELNAQMYRRNTPTDLFQEAKFKKQISIALKSSHVIAIVMKRQEIERIPEIEEIAAVACAVQNLHLTATAYGLAGYWSTGGGTYSQEMKEFFALSAKDKLMGFFYLGYPKTVRTIGKRTPVQEKTTWITQ
jgi:nitroreductase